MEETYEKAFTEVIELLKFFPRESLDKIPDEELAVYYTNRDKMYEYSVDRSKKFDEQDMMDKTKAIFAKIFRDYWATDYQKERILKKEQYDRYLIEEEKMRKYDSNNIFKNEISSTEANIEKTSDDLPTIVKDSFFSRIKNRIAQIFKRNK